ncbi:hypothetical protein ACFQ9X_26160 [Catenulispora yoronensis]
MLAVPGSADVAVGDTPPAARLPLADGWFSVRDGARTWRGYSASDTASRTRVWVVEPESVLNAKVRKLRGRVWLMAVIVSPVAFGVGALIGRRSIRPLTVLRNRAGRVSAAPGPGSTCGPASRRSTRSPRCWTRPWPAGTSRSGRRSRPGRPRGRSPRRRRTSCGRR